MNDSFPPLYIMSFPDTTSRVILSVAKDDMPDFAGQNDK
jgi:hypothetical protein